MAGLRCFSRAMLALTTAGSELQGRQYGERSASAALHVLMLLLRQPGSSAEMEPRLCNLLSNAHFLLLSLT